MAYVNIASELEVCVFKLEDRSAYQKKQNYIARDMTWVILPAIAKVADVFEWHWENIAPIGSVIVTCDHNQRKKQIETVNTKRNRKSAGIKKFWSLI